MEDDVDAGGEQQLRTVLEEEGALGLLDTLAGFRYSIVAVSHSLLGGTLRYLKTASLVVFRVSGV